MKAPSVGPGASAVADVPKSTRDVAGSFVVQVITAVDVLVAFAVRFEMTGGVLSTT
jgi:hypothetical protein